MRILASVSAGYERNVSSFAQESIPLIIVS